MDLKDIQRSRSEELSYFDFLEYAHDVTAIQEQFRASVPRVRLRARQDPVDSMRNVDFIRDHGMSKFVFCRILDLTRGQLDPKHETPIAVPAAQKLSCFLRLLRMASIHRCVAGNKDILLSPSMASRFINQAEYVKFPDRSEQCQIAHEISADYIS